MPRRSLGSQAELSERFDTHRPGAGGARRSRRQARATAFAPPAAATRPSARVCSTCSSANCRPALPATAGITVFDPTGTPLAWAGRVSDLPRERIDGPRSLFVALDALGPRLVRVEPVVGSRIARSGRGLPTIVVEQRVDAGTDVSPALADTLLLPTSVVDVAVRARPVPRRHAVA